MCERPPPPVVLSVAEPQIASGRSCRAVLLVARPCPQSARQHEGLPASLRATPCRTGPTQAAIRPAPSLDSGSGARSAPRLTPSDKLEKFSQPAAGFCPPPLSQTITSCTAAVRIRSRGVGFGLFSPGTLAISVRRKMKNGACEELLHVRRKGLMTKNSEREEFVIPVFSNRR
jgi:hypothetical protein